MSNYETLTLNIEHKVARVSFNRPEKANSLNAKAWEELQAVFEHLSELPEARVIILSGEGKHFCAGIDLSMLMSVRQETADDCDGRTAENMRKMVKFMQAPVNAIENCAKPVLAAIHGGCIGAGFDIICACDMRYCTADSFFTIKEIDMGMVADLGTLQRLPKIIPDGMARELAYTGRNMAGTEAADVGLCNRAYDTRKDMIGGVMEIAKTIAEKSPLSIRGSKEMIRYARDHSVADGLNYISIWNAAMMLSSDLDAAFMGAVQKTKPVFRD